MKRPERQSQKKRDADLQLKKRNEVGDVGGPMESGWHKDFDSWDDLIEFLNNNKGGSFTISVKNGKVRLSC